MFSWVGNSLYKISEHNFIDESEYVQQLARNIEAIDFTKIETQTLESLANFKKYKTNNLIESLINEFGIGSNEGLALMELAEALLRVPDKFTSYELITDKICNKDWTKYTQTSKSKINKNFIRLLNWAAYIMDKKHHNIINKAVRKISEPIINNFARNGVKMIGSQFVMGEDISLALKHSKKYDKYLFSYDVLGEGARDETQAAEYLKNYKEAVEQVGSQIDKNTPQHLRVGLSIKLSALHPKYEFSNYKQILEQLFIRVKEIILLAINKGINITIDAEESSRLPISLLLFEKLFTDEDLKDYTGFGLAVQAYNKSALLVLKFLSELAQKYNKEIPVRLVKGAYWDSEVKKAQMLGLNGFPVFTQKYHTDISYLACAQYILNEKYFYPQFATHNTYTVHAILEMAEHSENKNKFEFQRLHGMGEALHNYLIKERRVHSRIYAPIGSYADLLAYLVRRILENGASTSFVHMFSSENINIDELVKNPLVTAQQYNFIANERIKLPLKLYGDRLNSLGIDMGNVQQMQQASSEILKFGDKKWTAGPIIAGKNITGRDSDIRRSPADFSRIIGHVINATLEDCEQSMKVALDYFKIWSKSPMKDRVEIAKKLAELLEKNRHELTALLMLEVGKTFIDCEGEIREAIDFCRYYADKAENVIGHKIRLDSHHVGELNELTWHARGVFVCISPWNFPLAIFIGQIIAALLCGNVVIAKPSEQTYLIADLTIKLLLEAGLPANAIAFLPGPGSVVGNYFTTRKDIGGIAFTGSTVTAKLIEKSLATNHPSIIPIIAETGGQNCMIIDSTALLEQAVDDVVISAFGNAGQRCSALRVLYLQEEIADKMIELIKGAINVKKIGSAFNDFSVDIGPVIDSDAWEMLHGHITKMKDKLIYAYPLDETLLHRGFYVGPHIYKINSIKELEGEVFGPILHIIRYNSEDLNKIIEEVNSTGYGLTFGMESRIDTKYREVADQINAGNIYINRSMIGAVVGVQPFGGMGLSGTGFKAGGPHYLYRFCNEKCYTVNTAAARGATEILV